MRERAGLYRSSQAAKALGISVRTLYRLLAAGKIPEPLRNPDNGYRMWSEFDLEELRTGLKRWTR
ncbi:helix-turn-helix domain-containing protein [Paludibaculum fermentans]|uniref:helix-turn-helix domain-containing protein n=1 Tax=Paludibaculum fermentans TaxID=1473598 RepID=UPI003EB9577A